MRLRRITHNSDSELRQLIALQRETFPEYPKHTEESWIDFVDNYTAMSFNAVYENDELAGLFIYWDLENSYYIHFIAVFPEMRNRKIGQQIMDWVAVNMNNPVFLESEVPYDEITTRRLNFYKRNGFIELANDPEILSAERDGEEHPLGLMGTQQVENLDRHLIKIKETVYYAGT